MKYISLRVRNSLVLHGYTANNEEIVEKAPPAEFAEKLIAIDRIQSATEEYILVSSSHGRQMYWEYEGSLADLKAKLSEVGLLIS